ncbi:uncharacterized protein EDB91DRAFT_1252892 [Suillus paluster]|uniref:uncharacterized protein n=1 Tax=Suillus paluster TaxID=48578 RepID=UPI001B860ECB|nr:uncharacterized protein EDB91DRAFT_1252892 [Suillus paluster]KAG1729854.1 hypothetical protein EDB91DRAFT_1252892 [Suillus paluster]
MKDVADALNYIGWHAVLCEHLLNMGATYSNEEAIFKLLHDLPRSASWPQFKSISLVSSSSTPLTFDACVTCISVEAAHLTDEYALKSKPGSGYAAAVPTTNNVNPITGLHKHCHNPEGMFCTTVGCNKGDHNHAHCYLKGGGMEGQAPWLKNKKKEMVAAAVVAPVPALVPSPTAPAPLATITAFVGCQAAAELFLADLSCASIIEIPDADVIPLYPVNSMILSCLVAAGFNTILDLGMTTALIQDCSYFWTYSTADIVTVQTMNHGSLVMSGHGDCKHCICLINCLHVPSAMLNLLSVGWMLSKGWDCAFHASPPCCELVYRGSELRSIPMANSLCYINLEFLPASPCSPPALTFPLFLPDLAAFIHSAPTLDLWHAHLSHIGGGNPFVIYHSLLPVPPCHPPLPCQNASHTLWASILATLIPLF